MKHYDKFAEMFRTPRPTESAASLYPHPHLHLPHPSLNLEFRMSVTLNPRISVGPTPFGQRNCMSSCHLLSQELYFPDSHISAQAVFKVPPQMRSNF